ncbi:Ankyrin-2 [Cyphellophora attinorum]|uniref:Ankyrin-2 n=1 Tax=Cyphellophora attinorum TaxID=1664694 RepID=A0A0N1GZ85_9EURO|nr:Ankyrin-2 [Phialophora attinorum]KPI36270.1 Ankyrin-2 [Phialophora attinorum]
MIESSILSRFKDVLASYSDDFHTVQKILEEDPSLDINAIGYNGHGLPFAFHDTPLLADTDISPLHLACYLNNEQTVNVLLDRGAHQRPTSHSGVTPLHCTIQSRGDYSKTRKIVQNLLQRFPDPQTRTGHIETADHLGRTALHLAIHHSNYDLVEYLLVEEGADILKTTNIGQTCLHIAAQNFNCEITKYLLSRPEVDQEFVRRRDNYENTAWDIANGCGEPQHLYGAFRWRNVRSYLEKELSTKGVASMRTITQSHSLLSITPEADTHYSLEWLNNALLLKAKAPGRIIAQFANGLLDDHVKGGPAESSNALIRYREPSCVFDQGTDFISLVFPYFHLQATDEAAYWRVDSKRGYSYSHLNREWSYCVSSRSKSYGICLPLTLDEYCCSALTWETLSQRNEDQVYAKVNAASDSTGKLVSISQLWLWSFGNTVVVSPAGDPTFTDIEDPDDPDLGRGQATEVGERTGVMSRTGDPKRRVGQIIAHLLLYLDDPNKSSATEERESRWPAFGDTSYSQSTDESILNTFQKAITLVSEDVNQYLKHISMDKINSDQEKRYIHDIGDIREELSMIKRVVIQQEGVWKDFALTAWPDFWPFGPDGRMTVPVEILAKASDAERNEWRIIVKIPATFSKYYRRLEALDEDAARVEQAIAVKLDLMAKHATIRESHTSAIMSAAVFGFTLITIVFTPLSFFASLFALPIDSFQRSQISGRFSDESGMYTTDCIGRWIATGELVAVAVTFFAMWLAVRYGMGVQIFTPIWGRFRGACGRFMVSMEVQADKERPRPVSPRSGTDAQA